ncbi:RNA polymerase subunit sigma, partial [Salmonella enterica subsp. enterica]|nr:RNA polymerase subunit sigma [Salmonella enterica subsp. enterica]
RQSIINAICPYSVTGEVLDQSQEAEIRVSLVRQGVSSRAKVSRKVNHTQEDRQRNTPITDSEFLNYEARDADVLVLVSVAVASLSKERDRDVLLMRLGVEEQPLTLDEIGVKWDVSRERVRQIQERAFRRLASQARREGTPGAALKKLIESACSSSDAVAVWVLNIVHSDFIIPPRLATKFILHTAGFTNDNIVEIMVLFPLSGGYRG